MAITPRSFNLPFLVCFGTEDFFLDRDIERAKAWANRGVVLVDGHGLTDYELVSICEERSDRLRTVIVDDAQKVKGDKALKAYIEDRSKSDLSVILAAIVRSEKLPDVWSGAISKGKGIERKRLKGWSANNEISKWLLAEVERMGASFEKGLETTLLQSVGLDLYRLENELRKLVLLVGPGGKIEKKHIFLVTSPSMVSDPFQVAEAAISKDPKRAMNALSVLYKSQGDEVFVPVVSALMRQVEKTLLIRRMIDKGVPDEEVATAVGIKPWPFKNFAAPVARKYDASTLIRHMGRLCKLDADVKGPARSKRTLVELTVLAIAG